MRFGVRGGLNLTSLNTKKSWGDMETKLGYHLGIVTDVHLYQDLYLHPGVFLMTKGAKVDGVDTKIRASYLEVPVLLSYRFPLMDEMKLHLNFGPYLAYGIGGKIKPEHGSKVNTFDNDRLKRFDMGLTLGAGMNIDRLYVGLNYDLGLMNISDGAGKIRNRTFYVTFGYNF